MYVLNETSVQNMLKNIRKRMNMTISNYCMPFLFISAKNVVDYIAVGNRCHPPTFILSQVMLKMMSSHKSRKINKGYCTLYPF